MTGVATVERMGEPVALAAYDDVAKACARERGVAAYAALCGHDPVFAHIDHDAAFDRHVFASLLAIAASEPGALATRAGLAPDELACLLERWFPHAVGFLDRSTPQAADAEDEVAMVRDLLLAHRSTPGDEAGWLAAMVARRAVEPNHLWEDLGLRDRSELSRLLSRHFAPLAARNTRNMRWKRFFYRSLCETDGLVMCTAPVCTACRDFDLCFGAEDGESRLAQRRREGESRSTSSFS
jgi:nitrogen fixation protein NifQ